MSNTLLIKVSTPCAGQQVVTEQSTDFYAGSAGSYTFAQVTKPSSATRWFAVIYDYSNPSGPCYPTKRFVQVTPNASDPRGAYQGEDSNGDPDPSLGEANVEDWP